MTDSPISLKSPATSGSKDSVFSRPQPAAGENNGPPWAIPADWTAPPDGPIPVEKRFDPVWLKQLVERGTPRVYTKGDSSNFDFIGMPVGGIGQGMLYLTGDGRLWRWDIFNAEIPDAEFWYEPGVEYEHPLKQDETTRHPVNRLRQGFAIRVGQAPARSLDRHGFENVTFRGAYPVGEVAYQDPACPLGVQLTAFSPFIPMDVARSSYPATLLRYTFTNRTDSALDCCFSGWMENGNAWKTRHIAGGRLVNRIDHIGGRPVLVLEAQPDVAVSRNSDVGSQCLAIFSDGPMDLRGNPLVSDLPAGCFLQPSVEYPGLAETPFSETHRPVGALNAAFTVEPGGQRVLTCVVAWHNPYATTLLVRSDKHRSNSKRFRSAVGVVETLAGELDQLTAETLLWRDTWNTSTLPAWFLDRTFANTAVLASSTFHALADGRFYGYEGCYSCPGTCTHVYLYAQAAARLFPSLERAIRETVDLGLAFDARTGQIGTRGEDANTGAVDGQAGTILRFYREHLLSADDRFLTSNWSAIKLSFQPLFAKDPDRAGLLTGAQWNTLDADWHGTISWLSGLYVAALRAGEAMAEVCGDPVFAAECRTRAEAGSGALSRRLFKNGRFINLVDPSKPESTNSGSGCHVDQVLGQSWAFQVGLPRVFDREQTLSALHALWRNNFTTDVGPYRRTMPGGRNYAMPGEGGLIMCTFPDPDWDFTKASGNGQGAYPYYLNECMSGFEYQVAGHMIWEGLTMEGLAVVRAIDDRYDGAKRNPWNEVECGSHYARAMASYGVFLAACGFEYDGPAGRMGFAPRLHPEDFRAAFTAAEGWGTYEQRQAGGTFTAALKLQWGRLKLTALTLSPEGLATPSASATIDDKPVAVHTAHQAGRVSVEFAEPLELSAGQSLHITVVTGR